jgi:hypothetical protein
MINARRFFEEERQESVRWLQLHSERSEQTAAEIQRWRIRVCIMAGEYCRPDAVIKDPDVALIRSRLDNVNNFAGGDACPEFAATLASEVNAGHVAAK